MTTTSSPVLEAKQMCAGYGAVEVVKDLDLVVHSGEVVALLGVNGAGKTTVVRALSGQLKPVGRRGLVQGPSDHCAAAQEGQRWHAPYHRGALGLHGADDGGESSPRRPAARACLQLFPELERLLHLRAGLLSGGEQQILTLARALAARPSVLLADELSLGLAPLVCVRLLSALRSAADRGAGVYLSSSGPEKRSRSPTGFT